MELGGVLSSGSGFGLISPSPCWEVTSSLLMALLTGSHSKYERLLNFCFKCGTIKHAKSRCTKGPSPNKLQDNEMAKYGPWLWASPAKITWKTQIQKSNSSSSSFDNQKTIEEEVHPANLDHMENIHNVGYKQAKQHEKAYIVASSS